LTDRSKQFVLFIFSKGQYIVSGSDDGSFFIWEKETTNLVRILQGDESIVNCLQPHPSYCFLATSGIDPVVRLWNPRPEVTSKICDVKRRMFYWLCFLFPQTDGDNGRVVEDMEGAAQANQRRMNADPLEVFVGESHNTKKKQCGTIDLFSGLCVASFQIAEPIYRLLYGSSEASRCWKGCTHQSLILR
ncbi:WD and tetratricopeptide repeats protein, partial [Goodea atripinnis]